MNDTLQSIRHLESIAPLGTGYDAWLCDVWGVVHNGAVAFPNAVEALSRYREQGGIAVLISNSPRPGDGVREQLRGIGVPDDCYDGLATSGDVTRALLVDRDVERVFHLGPSRDLAIFEGLDIERVDGDEAEICVCSGLYDDESETPEDYRALLRDLSDLEIELICANPDIVVERGDKLIYCAGALAELYENYGGKVVYAGKPHRPIYDLASAVIEDLSGRQLDRSKILCIGDGVATDIAGAAASGHDSVFIASAVHVDGFAPGDSLDPEGIVQLFDGLPSRPLGAMSELVW